MQVALRDKENQLVQTAMERMRRAKAKGKANVKLSQPELDALLRQQDLLGQTAGLGKVKSRERRPSGTKHDPRAAHSPSTSSPPLSRSLSRRGSGKGKGKAKDSPMMMTQSTSATSLASSKSTKTRSSAKKQLYPAPSLSDPLGPTSSPSSSARPGSSRRAPLPHEPDWVPRARSNSSATTARGQHASYTAAAADFLGYRNSGGIPPPLPVQYTPYRRNVSNPTEPSSTSIRRKPVGSKSGASPVQRGGGARLPPSSSDPHLSAARRQVIVIRDSDSDREESGTDAEESSDDGSLSYSDSGSDESRDVGSGDDDSDDGGESDNGVRVNVSSAPQVAPVQTRSGGRSVARPREQVPRRRR
jgi:hypothetical protein